MKFLPYITYITLSIWSVLLADQSWFASIKETKALLKSNQTILIDARSESDYKKSHIAGAHHLTWEGLSQQDIPKKGNLLPTNEIVSILENLGISNDSKILIYGDPLGGWGEEGRITWTLRSLGQNKTFIVDGGFPELKKSGLPTTRSIPTVLAKGNFTPSPEKLFTVYKEEVKKELSNQNVVFLDVREEREYVGGVPYGEARGGHLPGAKHIYYKSLLDSKGNLLSKDKIKSLLKEKGIDENTTVINYCTGGVRSGWFTAVMNSIGYNAKNYPGSMWEWSHLSEKEYPLVRGVK